jgi:hypothetical protein
MRVEGSPATGQPGLHSSGQTARFAESDPALWATVFLGTADFAAQQLILGIDHRPNEQNHVLPVVELLDIGRSMHGRTVRAVGEWR